MQLTAGQKLKPLGRTLTPYAGQAIIFLGVTVYAVWVAHKTSQWEVMWLPAVLWALYGGLVYFGLKYRILWDKHGVVMRASGGAERRIQYDEITEIKMEMARPSEFLSQARPFRRIIVHGCKHMPDASVDISLRHFRLEDVKELLTTIHARRPDLAVPTVPEGRRFL